MDRAVDMDATQDGLVIGSTFLLTITPICYSISGARHHSVGVYIGDGTMI